MMRLLALLSSVLLWAGSPAALGDTEGAVHLLERMSLAVNTSSYIGEFTLERDGRLERLRIIHRVRDGEVSEKLVSITEPGRQLTRIGDEVTVYLPDAGLAVAEHRPGRASLLGMLPRGGRDLTSWYDIVLEGLLPELNGRPAAVISGRPRDGYRFGQRLWIDEQTALPVRMEVLDEGGAVIERMRFSHLELHRRIPDDRLQPQGAGSGLKWVRHRDRPGATSGWTIDGAPPGFELMAVHTKDLRDIPSPVTQMVWSDGLATASVFIHSAPSGVAATGAGRAGAASTFTAQVAGHQVTAVGEVPMATLRKLVSGARPSRR
ncbi:MAG: MucB/RseB C-terminal domain-containing protein [Steroidobacteraceae bacterium]